MTPWYVIQVATGSEETMCELIARVAPPQALKECFYPRYETLIKLRGRRVATAKPLFPGYLIAVSNDPLTLEDALTRIPEFARVLSNDGQPAALQPEEVQVIDAFTHPGQRVVPMSHAFKSGEKIVIVDGPLMGHEAMVKEVHRHKCGATVEFDFCGRKVTTRVGLAVLSEPDALNAQAARLKAKVAYA